MAVGFAYCHIIVNTDGKPVDFEIVEANQASAYFRFIKEKNLIGKKITEIYPNLKQDPYDWIGVLCSVAVTDKH
jgi:hypothetical protein